VADEVAAIAAETGISTPGRDVIDVLDLAIRLAEDPAGLEQQLLSLAEREVLGYRPVLRAMSLEHRREDWDRDSVEASLRRLHRSAFDRLETMLDYAGARTCRRARILKQFDESSPETCNACDICVGEPEALGNVDPVRYADVDVVTEQVVQAIVGLVREASRLNSTPGRGSFAKGLRGVARWRDFSTPTVLQRSRHFGSLRYLTEQEINEAIDVMIDRGRILEVERERSDGGTYVGLDVRL
jgi:hypothetical protein